MKAALAPATRAQPQRATPVPAAPVRRRVQAPMMSLSAIPARPTVQPKCASCATEDHDALPVRPRLEVGPAGDRYEREADAIAGQVMAMRDTQASAGASTVQRSCSACASEDSLQPRRSGDAASDTGLAASAGELTSGGAPLPPATRQFFEPRMGRDLSAVRLHRGRRAFTFQDHIWLGRNEGSAPSFTMAHELAHVMQQTDPKGVEGQGRTQTTDSAATARALPVAVPPVVIAIGAVVGKCIVGAIAGALFDAAIQAAQYAYRMGTWRFWEAKLDYCSMVLSAVIGCFAAPIGAATLEPWLARKLGPVLGGGTGTLIGKLLMFLIKKVGMGIPKGLVGSLAKLGCITPAESARLQSAQGGSQSESGALSGTTGGQADEGRTCRSHKDPAIAVCRAACDDIIRATCAGTGNVAVGHSIPPGRAAEMCSLR